MTGSRGVRRNSCPAAALGRAGESVNRTDLGYRRAGIYPCWFRLTYVSFPPKADKAPLLFHDFTRSTVRSAATNSTDITTPEPAKGRGDSRAAEAPSRTAQPRSQSSGNGPA